MARIEILLCFGQRELFNKAQYLVAIEFDITIARFSASRLNTTCDKFALLGQYRYMDCRSRKHSFVSNEVIGYEYEQNGFFTMRLCNAERRSGNVGGSVAAKGF